MASFNRSLFSVLALTLAGSALSARGPLDAGLPQRTRLAAQRMHELRPDLDLNEEYAFRVRSVHDDDLGQTHVRFNQTFQGVRVWEGESILHLDAEGSELGRTIAVMNGIRVNTMPSLEATEILGIVHQDQNPTEGYAHAPSVELVVFPHVMEAPRLGLRQKDGQNSASDFVRETTGYTLAYHVHTEIESENETAHTDYILDAHTGGILQKWSTLHTTAAVGTGKSQYSGTVSLNTNSTATGFEFRDMTRGTGGNYVLNLNKKTSGGSIYTDADNTWGDGLNYATSSTTTSANGQTAAVDAGYGAQKTWDYYKLVHGRNGIDGAGRATYSRVHYSRTYDNAFWSDTCFCMTYGDGSSFKVLTALDVAGHEMSHGVCSRTANLTYSGESGGLNEANSDIHGTMAEFYARGGSGSTIGNTGGNWTIGEQLYKTSGALRYMYKPSLDGASPDAWSSTLKNLDVHYSSGPANRMFYFLSQGTGTGNYSSTYLPGGMTGIGNDKAARIWFRAMVVYMTASTNYAAAKIACTKAATDLYGATSAEYAAVVNAFKAINVN
jgi:Zn-dependent metalloprotease